MCLYIKNPKRYRPLIAKKDIVVYKIVRYYTDVDRYYTPYQSQIVIFDENGRCTLKSDANNGLMRGEISLKTEYNGKFRYDFWAGRDGVHFDTASDVPDAKDCETIRIYQGIHAYRDELAVKLFLATNFSKSYNGIRYIIFEAIIPKGAAYYEGEFNQVVADEIILHEDKLTAVVGKENGFEYCLTNIKEFRYDWKKILSDYTSGTVCRVPDGLWHGEGFGG